MIFIRIRIIWDFVIRPAIFIISEKCGIAKSVRVSKIKPGFSKKNLKILIGQITKISVTIFPIRKGLESVFP